MYSFTKASNSRNGIAAMVSLARSEPGVSVGVSELDTDPWLFNVQNGTLDLRTGELQEHCRDDLITKLAPVMFDPAAECPLWDTFLQEIFDGDEELIGYTQRLAGYNLSGSTREHVLVFLYGVGANGKSTFIETQLALMGPDYAIKAAPDLLMAKQGESHPTERADLFGKRFVATVETEAGKRLAESLVKELTGGDRIRARRMREDFWEFTPTHHVWLAGNHKPAVYGTDHGLWRRLKLIPFKVKFPDKQQDKELSEKLKAELPGILNWALAGCLDWQKNGMQEPESVRAATEEYAQENDVVGEFIDAFCEVSEGVEAPATELFEQFRKHYPDSRMSQRIFGAQLQQRELQSFRITRGPNKARKGWRGIQYVGCAETKRVAAQLKAKAEENKRKAKRGGS